ncbi:MAG: tetratricopeptide repeat protein [Pseudomonadota bacterium]
MRRCFARSALLLAFAPVSLAALASTESPLAEARRLLDQRQPQAAFDLLAPLEDERGGDPDFDYVFGVAALETGKAGVAAFAFERCLAVDPRNGPCRVQMARTHLALGESGSARRELEAVQGSQPPAEVEALVGQYLGALTRRERSEKRQVGAWAQLGLGYDSNVTSTTAQDQIALPAFGGLPFVLQGLSSKQEDGFLQGEAGVDLGLALGPAWRLLGNLVVAGRRYDDVAPFDNLASNAEAGAAWRAGHHSVLAKLQAQDYQLGHNDFRSLYGVLGQYQYAFSDTAALSVYGQASHLDNHVLFNPDADRYTLGGAYSRALGVPHAPVVYAGLYLGAEESEASGPGLSQEFLGLRLGGSLGVSAALRLTASLSVERRAFDGVDVLFQVEREDTVTDLGLGAVYRLSPQLSLRPAYTFSNSESNVVLSDFDRHVVSFDVRYEM